MSPTFYPEEGFDPKTLAGKPLVIPSVSLGNLPQLVVDLLITSLSLKRVGYVGDGSTVAPFAGVEADGEAVTGGLTVYGRGENDIFFLQQRAPTLKSHKEEHLGLLVEFITSSQFEVVLVLASMDAANQDDAQLSIAASHPLLSHLRRLPPLSLLLGIVLATTSGLPAGMNASADPAEPYPPFLPSAGGARALLARLQTAGVPHGALAAWCVEGDNRGDARAMAQEVLKVVGLDKIELKEPAAWTGIFGGVDGWSGGQGENSELYG